MGNISDIFGAPFAPTQNKYVEPPEVQLKDCMTGAGLMAPKVINFDGRLHRFSTNGKKGDTAGWYIAHLGLVPAAAFGDWREGLTHSWRADLGRDLTIAEQLAHSQRLEEIRRVRDAELTERREVAADNAKAIWNQAGPASDNHEYLIRKHIKAHTLRVSGDGRLIAPIYLDGEISSIQYIAGDGAKLFMKGGAVAGGYTTFGQIIGASEIYIAEGVATAITIHEATNKPVVCTFSANNMTAAAQTIRKLYGINTAITIVADNDESGTGQREGQKAADAIAARLVISPQGDANDYALAGGDLVALLATSQEPVRYILHKATDLIREPKPIHWLIKGIMPQCSLGMIHGPSGGGKSFIAIDMMLAIATGQDNWCGHKITKGPVLYLAGEGHQGITQRLKAWFIHNGIDDADMWVSERGTDLNTAEGYREVVEAIRAMPVIPCTIGIDTLHRFLAGDENSAQDAKTMIDACAALSREFNCTVILVHHTGVSEEAQHRARGSSAWKGALDFEMSVVPAKDGEPMQIIQRKQKDAELANPVHMMLQRIELGWIDDDGEIITSAVPMQTDAPVKVAKESKAQGKYRKMFEEAYLEYGDVKDGVPYLTSNGWNQFTKDQDWASEATRRSTLSKAKTTLLEEEYLFEMEDGFGVSEGQNAASLIILKRNRCS